MLLPLAANTENPVYLPKKNLSFSHYAIFERQYSRTGSYPSGRLLHWQTAEALVQYPLFVDRKILPLFTTHTHSIQVADPPTHPPTHPPQPYPPPLRGVGTLGLIAQNQSNPPTHRPQTHPPTHPGG